MLLWWMLCEIRNFLKTRNEKFVAKTANSYLDIFMGLFMLCTIEVVIMKILFFYEDTERIFNTLFLLDEDDNVN